MWNIILIADVLVRNQNDFGSINCSYSMRFSGIWGLGNYPEARLKLDKISKGCLGLLGIAIVIDRRNIDAV